MKREGVIVTSFKIQSRGQVRLFQVRIPREADEVIGVELGGRWISGALPAPPSSGGGVAGDPLLPPDVIAHSWHLPFQQQRNVLLGEAKLQSYEKANIFFSGDLVLNKNLDMGDYSSLGFPPKEYTHQFMSEETQVSVRQESTLIQGMYRDKAGETVSGPYSYQVNIYVWMAAKEDQSNL